MSAPDLVLREAEQLRYGVLSVKASTALRAVLANHRLSEEDREVLRQAGEFLARVADGARIASTGTFRAGSSPSSSMAALDFAELLRNIINIEGNRAAFFRELASAVTNSSNNRLRAQQRAAAEKALVVFESLHRVLQHQRELRRLDSGASKKTLTA